MVYTDTNGNIYGYVNWEQQTFGEKVIPPSTFYNKGTSIYDYARDDKIFICGRHLYAVNRGDIETLL